MEKIYDFYERYRDYIMSLVLLLFLIGSIILGYYYINKKVENLNPKEDKSISIEEKPKQEEINKIYVDVKGEVKNPGVYNLDSNKRVIDAVNKAGGITGIADCSITNLSKKLKDEMVIIIYSKKQVKKMSKIEKQKTKAIEKCKEESTNNNACLDEPVKTTKESTNQTNKNSSSEKPKGKISINTASKEELMTLTGIGESKAINIIDYRNKNKFNDISDIKNVKGIGDSIFEKIKDNITT